MYYVYCYKNLINGKVYIGKTNNFSRRKNRHRRNAFIGKLTLPFYNALRKYSEDGFEFSILDQFEQEDIIFDLEKFYINALKSTDRQYGYNITVGGEGAAGTKHNDNQKRSNKLRFGANNGCSKMNDTIAIDIYNEYKSGISISELMKKYLLSHITLERLLSGRSWKHLQLNISALSEVKKQNIMKARVRGHLP